MDIDGIVMSEFYPCATLCEKLPGRRPGQHVCSRTVERWRRDGLQRGGTRIKLRAIRLANDFYTCDRWLKDFLVSGNPDDNAAPVETGRPRTPSQRERASADARKSLDEMWQSKRPT